MDKVSAWRYVAEKADGSVVKGRIDALNEAAAARSLRSNALTPVSIDLQSSVSRNSFRLIAARRRLSTNETVSFCRELADLLSANVPLGHALSLLSGVKQSNSKASFVTDLVDRVRSGSSLSAALRASKTQTPPLIAAMTAAGETTGDLAGQFRALATHFEDRERLQRELIAQSIYPLALLVLIILTIVFLSHFVLPQFESIFQNADRTPPPETRIVMAAGAWLREYGAWAPLAFLVMLVGGKQLVTHRREWCERVALNTPVVGSSWRKLVVGRYCRSLGALLAGGASMTTGLAIAEQSISVQTLQRAFHAAAGDINSGATFTRAINDRSLFPNDVAHFAKLGEESGLLGEMLLKAAARCEQDVKLLSAKITGALSPALTALMGLVTAGVIASVMSGVLSLNETVY